MLDVARQHVRQVELDMKPSFGSLDGRIGNSFYPCPPDAFGMIGPVGVIRLEALAGRFGGQGEADVERALIVHVQQVDRHVAVMNLIAIARRLAARLTLYGQVVLLLQFCLSWAGRPKTRGLAPRWRS